MKKHKIFGIVFEKLQKCSDLFNYELDDMNFRICAVSKKTYKYEEGEYNFQYKYVINVEWVEGIGQLTLSLIPTINSLSEEFRKEVSEFTLLKQEEIKYNDIFDTGGGSVDFNCMALPENAMDEDVIYHLDKCASIIDLVDNNKNHYFDKSWHLIGNNGWSILDNCLKKEKIQTEKKDKAVAEKILMKHIKDETVTDKIMEELRASDCLKSANPLEEIDELLQKTPNKGVDLDSRSKEEKISTGKNEVADYIYKSKTGYIKMITDEGREIDVNETNAEKVLSAVRHALKPLSENEKTLLELIKCQPDGTIELDKNNPEEKVLLNGDTVETITLASDDIHYNIDCDGCMKACRSDADTGKLIEAVRKAMKRNRRYANVENDFVGKLKDWYEVKVPEWCLPYFANGELEGYTEEEIRQMDKFNEKYKGKLLGGMNAEDCCIPLEGESPDFTTENDITGKEGSDTYKFCLPIK